MTIDLRLLKKTARKEYTLCNLRIRPILSFLGRPADAHSINFEKIGRKVESLNLYIILMATALTELSISLMDSVDKSSSWESVHSLLKSKAFRKMDERMVECFVTADLGCLSIAVLKTSKYSCKAYFN